MQGRTRSISDTGLGGRRTQTLWATGRRSGKPGAWERGGPRAPAHLGAHGVVVASAREGAPQLGDLARGLVDGDHVPAGGGGGSEERKASECPCPGRSGWPNCSPGLDLVLGQRLDHLGAEVVYGLHLRGLEGQLAHLGALRRVTRQARPQKGPRCLPNTASKGAGHREALGGDGCIHCHGHGHEFMGARVCQNLSRTILT